MLGNFIVSRLTGQVTPRQLIEAGCVLLAASGLIVALLGGLFGDIAACIAVPMLLFGLGNGLLMPNAMLRSMSVSPTLVGSSSALSGCLRMGAGSLGSLIVVSLPIHGGVALGLLVAAMGALSLLSFVGLSRGEP